MRTVSVVSKNDFVSRGGGLVNRVKDTHYFHAVLGRRDTSLCLAAYAVNKVIHLITEHLIEILSLDVGMVDVDQPVVHLGIQMQPVVRKVCARFRAEQFNAVFRLAVQAEARLYAQRTAVVEPHKRRDHILDVHGRLVLRVVARGDIALRRFDIGAVKQFLIGCTVDGNGFRIALEIAHEVDDVHAQVDQRTAAGAGLVAEPAARMTVAADIGSFGIIDFAKEIGVFPTVFSRPRSKVTNKSGRPTDRHRFIKGFRAFQSIAAANIFGKLLDFC